MTDVATLEDHFLMEFRLALGSQHTRLLDGLAGSEYVYLYAFRSGLERECYVDNMDGVRSSHRLTSCAASEIVADRSFPASYF